MSERPEERYPLTWPVGWPRTPTWKRGHSPFRNVSTDKAMRELMDELGRLGASRVLISSNLKLRQDGYPYSQQPRNDDEGIAVYFVRKGQNMVLACDKFAKREDNLRAITKTIDAIRGIERWGSSDMMERAFTGFTQIGHDAGRHWWDVLGVPSDAHATNVEQAYRRRRSATHPDKGGDATEFAAVESAWQKFQAAQP
jgi:hypothetical protein